MRSRRGRASAALGAALPALAVLSAPGCRDEEPPPKAPAVPFVAPESVTRPAEEPLPDLRFTDMTADAGVAFVHETGADGRKLLPETMGSGCAWLDYDADGDPDLLLLSGRPWRAAAEPAPTVRLWRNDGGWRFTEVTREAGLAGLAPYALGVACADTDGDGDQDVVVTGIGGYWFLRNDGGRFTVLPKEDAGLDPGTWTDSEGATHGPFATSAAFLDVDGDGRTDLFVCHYVHWSEKTDVWSSINGKDKSYAIPTQYQGESCRLWRNLGGNRFEDLTDRAGMRQDEGKSLGVAVLDLNGDPYPDLVVANDTQPNYVWCSRGPAAYDECGTQFGIAYGPDGRARAGMGIDVALLGARNRPSVAIGNFSGEPVGLWEWKGSVFVNRSDVAAIAEPTLPSLTFGVRFADLDLDGRLDLVLANGHIEPTWQEVHKDVPYRQPVQILHQRVNGTFRDVTSAAGPGAATPRVHRGLATADVDGDGDLDLCVTVNGGPAVLLRNDTSDPGRRSLRVRVVGEAPATDALGARVTVECGAGDAARTLTDTVRSGGSYLSESERTLVFGLGDTGKASKVTVRWPDGHERTFTDVAPGLLRATR